jgi:hypothetical protein
MRAVGSAIGDAAEIKTKRVRKQKTDREDARLLLSGLLMEGVTSLLPSGRRYTQNILSLPTTPFVVAAINIFSVCPLTIQVA